MSLDLHSYVEQRLTDILSELSDVESNTWVSEEYPLIRHIPGGSAYNQGEEYIALGW